MSVKNAFEIFFFMLSYRSRCIKCHKHDISDSPLLDTVSDVFKM